MSCDLDKTVGRSCILRSPSIPDTFNWTCMVVSYSLTSRDVNLTLELLVDDVVNISETLSADEYIIFIPNRNWGSPVRLQLTASRFLAITEEYVFADVHSVAFRSFDMDIGKLLCFTAKLMQKYIEINRFFMKLFKTSSIVTVRDCQSFFGVDLPSIVLAKRFDKFVDRYGKTYI